jgi:hypothetical protein
MNFKLPEETRARLPREVVEWIEGYAVSAPDVESGDESPGDVAESMVALFDRHAANMLAASNMKKRGLGFGAALEALKNGHRVTRAGWNGKGMWLALVSPDPGIDDPKAEPVDGYYTVNLDVGNVEYPGRDLLTARSSRVQLLPWIGMKTADDGFVPWLASQTDLLAEDWEIVGVST